MTENSTEEVEETTDTTKERLSTKGAIRAKCLDCANNQREEIRECPIQACPLYAFRPYRNDGETYGGRPKREISEEQRQAASERFKKYHAERKEAEESTETKKGI